MVGHNKFYEQILVEPLQGAQGEDLMGKWCRVRIAEVSKFHMKAAIISTEMRETRKEEAIPTAIRMWAGIRDAWTGIADREGKTETVLMQLLLVSFLFYVVGKLVVLLVLRTG